jgi:hypothetical protein
MLDRCREAAVQEPHRVELGELSDWVGLRSAGQVLWRLAREAAPELLRVLGERRLDRVEAVAVPSL